MLLQPLLAAVEKEVLCHHPGAGSCDFWTPFGGAEMGTNCFMLCMLIEPILDYYWT